MSENREAAIKLFGAVIPLEKFQSQDLQVEETSPKSTDQGHESADLQEKVESTTSATENNKPSSTDQEDTSACKSEEQQPDIDQSSSKAKKLDKILPCPRCKSQDTKFCYFNNYNVNQPRHYCKNCQRYWTAGGSMRNVPVGAGRRKSKSSSHYRDMAASDSSIQALPNGTVLSFGVNVPICNSMVSRSEETSTTPIPCLSNVSSPWPCPWAAAPPLCSIPFVPIPQGTWSVQWLSPLIGSCNPTLGKHSRDENMLKNNHLVKDESQKPKTVRIDDNIREAAKNSIWTMLGVKAFKPKLDIKNHVLETSSVMHANPAALTRHLNFQEAINK